MEEQPTNLEVGKLGEDLAEKYLKDRGYEIITRNYRQPWGEIDIVTKSKNKTLTFFEIKTLKKPRFNNEANIKPEDNLTASKLSKLKKICESFANSNPKLITGSRGWQIDLLTIWIKNFSDDQTPSLTEIEKDCEMKHYENI